MMRTNLLATGLVCCLAAGAIGKVSNVERLRGVPRIPEGITIEGDPVYRVRWHDKNGLNEVILSQKGPLRAQDSASNHLYGYHFVGTGRQRRQIWRMHDFVDECQFDFLGAPTITDLDDDGEGETTILYTLTCRSDPSPAPAKLLMYEGGKKYAIRGYSAVSTPEGRTLGTMTLDPAFKSAPRSFRDHAIHLFTQNVTEQTL
jgi:hypothetical protein